MADMCIAKMMDNNEKNLDCKERFFKNRCISFPKMKMHYWKSVLVYYIKTILS